MLAEGHHPEPHLRVEGLSVRTAERPILSDVCLNVPPRRVTAVLGPSGAGKSTLLRCLNRLVELVPELSVTGRAWLGREAIFGPSCDPDRLRARVGLVLQEPVCFPGSIRDNVLFGLSRLSRLSRSDLTERAEAALRQAALWEEVQDRLGAPARELSVGQRQRLALARVLALEPEVLLMDEPTSALDPASAAAIERLVSSLAREITIVLVTHNRAQARRLADRVAYLAAPSPGAGATVLAQGTLDEVLAATREHAPEEWS
ncbi:MAG TPA: ATP-binding cassette domain-containing protein [Thermoanaerobaculia bacterium]|nr:ATP-binding cassette domain-containing protein [Thermoanaerobaculia bacterium]